MQEETKRTITEYSSVNHYARKFKFFEKVFYSYDKGYPIPNLQRRKLVQQGKMFS